MARVYRPVFYTLLAGALLGIAAPAFACISEGNRSYAKVKDEDSRDCDGTDANQVRQPASAQSKGFTILRVQDDAGYLRNAYVDGNGLMLQVEDDE